MPKAYIWIARCETLHILTTVNQLHSLVSQVLFLLVKLNDLDSGFEMRFHYFLKSASYGVTFLHCSLPFQIPHVQRQFLFQLPWLCHWFLPLPPPFPIFPPSPPSPHTYIHQPSNLTLTYSIQPYLTVSQTPRLVEFSFEIVLVSVPTAPTVARLPYFALLLSQFSCLVSGLTSSYI